MWSILSRVGRFVRSTVKFDSTYDGFSRYLSEISGAPPALAARFVELVRENEKHLRIFLLARDFLRIARPEELDFRMDAVSDTLKR